MAHALVVPGRTNGPTSPLPMYAGDAAPAPFLLVGGTGDRSWDVDVARRLTPHVFSVDDADHGMYVPGPLRDSVTALGNVVDAIEAFLGEISWPG